MARNSDAAAGYSKMMSSDFRGTIQYDDSICCDDLWAAFLEAQVNCPVSKIMDKPDDLGMLEQMIPADITSRQAMTGHLLLVQANFFECGGLAIGVSMSHEAANVCMGSTFIKTCAATALGMASSTSNGDHHQVLLPPDPDFGAVASFYPPLDFLHRLWKSLWTIVLQQGGFCLMAHRLPLSSPKLPGPRCQTQPVLK
ncbi:hypothetical protein ACFX2B_020808 [Malus domestica]